MVDYTNDFILLALHSINLFNHTFIYFTTSNN